MDITAKDGKQLRLETTLWLQHGNVKIKVDGDFNLLEGENEDAYVKILNHFGRVLKLFTFENGVWEDAETGLPPTGFDASLAGRLPTLDKPGVAKKARAPKAKTSERKTATKAGTKSKASGNRPGPSDVKPKSSLKKNSGNKTTETKPSPASKRKKTPR